jgi:hypothetical protein
VLISQANRVLFGVRWAKYGGGLRWCRALEYQKRDVIHYHALITGVQDLRRLFWMDRWHELAGYARIEPIESSAAVSRYVSKYVIKGGELDLSPNLVPPALAFFEDAQVAGGPGPLLRDLVPKAAFRPGGHEPGSEAGSVKAAKHPEGAWP